MFKGGTTERVHVHMAHYASVTKTGTTGSEKYTIDISEYAGSDKVLADAPFFVLTAENGSIVGDVIKNVVVTSTETSSGSGKYTTTVEISTGGATYEGSQVFVDYYIEKSAAKVSELQIDAEHFAGNYYVEAETLFRRESDGVDMPAIITLPNVKIQSNFTFSMASTGEPSTFDFTMDALPGYTYFRKDKKVLCVIQIVEDASSADDFITSVMPHPAGSVANGGGTGSTATGGNNIPKYFYETDKDGNIISAYNDINNDSIVDTNDYDEP